MRKNREETIKRIQTTNIKPSVKFFIEYFVDLGKYHDNINQLVEDLWFDLFNDAVSEVAEECLDRYEEEHEEAI